MLLVAMSADLLLLLMPSYLVVFGKVMLSQSKQTSPANYTILAEILGLDCVGTCGQ